MSIKIAAYMQHLTGDPSALAEHRRDPKAAMTKFGLSAADQAIVSSGDHEKIREAVAGATAELARTMVITT